MHFSSESYRPFPTYKMLVCGQEVEFLVDFGATHSVLKSDSFTRKPVLGGRCTHSISASGTVQKENFTTLLACIDERGSEFKHGFLWCDLCPVNLLARDLMCKLNINLIFSPEGITILQEDYDHTMVKYSPHPSVCL